MRVISVFPFPYLWSQPHAVLCKYHAQRMGAINEGSASAKDAASIFTFNLVIICTYIYIKSLSSATRRDYHRLIAVIRMAPQRR